MVAKESSSVIGGSGQGHSHAFPGVRVQSSQEDSWDLVKPQLLSWAANPCFSLAPYLSLQTAGPRAPYPHQFHALRAHTFLLRPEGLPCPFPYIRHPGDHPFCRQSSCPSPTCPPKPWLDLMVPQGLLPSLPPPASASPLYSCVFVWHVSPVRVGLLSISPPECEFMSLLGFYTPIETLGICASWINIMAWCPGSYGKKMWMWQHPLSAPSPSSKRVLFPGCCHQFWEA